MAPLILGKADRAMSYKLINEIKKAIDTEAEGISFYKYAAEIVKDAKGRAVFERLAEDELDHIRVLTSLSDSLEKDGKWISYKDALQKGRVEGNEKTHIFPPVSKIKDWDATDPTDIDALRFGIKIEEKAVEYYKNGLQGTDKEEERAFFSSMVEIEEGHLKLLEWEYDSLTRSGFWCDQIEYSVEGEK